MKYLSNAPKRLVRFLQLLGRTHIGVSAISFLLGILLYQNLIAAGLIVIFIYSLNRKWKFILAIIFVVIGFLYAQSYYVDRIEETRNSPIDTRSFSGVLIEDGRQRDFDQTIVIRAEGYKSYIQAKVSKYPLLTAGQNVTLQAQIESIPDDYSQSYTTYLQSRNIFLIGENAQITSIQTPTNFITLFSSFRYDIVSLINKNTQEPESSLMAGITTGFDDSFTDEYKEQLQKTGTTHIVAVSGFNFMLLYSIILGLEGFVHRKRLQAFALIVMIGYLLLVGTSNLPAMRAAIMISIIIVSGLLGKPRIALDGLLLTAFAMCLMNPLTLFNISFQLSFSATVGILLLGKQYTIVLKQIMPKFFAEITSITLAAFLATSPVIAVSFGPQSFISILANLAISEIVGIATVFSLAAILFSFVPFINSLLFEISEALLLLINQIIFIMSTLPELQVSNPIIYITFTVIIMIILDFIFQKQLHETTN